MKTAILKQIIEAHEFAHLMLLLGGEESNSKFLEYYTKNLPLYIFYILAPIIAESENKGFEDSFYCLDFAMRTLQKRAESKNLSLF